MRFFEKFDSSIQKIFKDIIASQQTEIATQILLIANASITLYILWSGYKVLAGKTQAPVQDLVWDLAKFAIILMFINNTGGYLTASVNAINGMKAGFSGGVSVWSSLDNLWGSTQTLANKLYDLDESTYVPISGWSGSVMVWLGSILIMSFASFVYMTADITMILLITTAPMFIFCLMFGFLRSMFNNWLQALFTSVLIVLLVTIVINFAMVYQGNVLGELKNATEDSNLFTLGAMGLLVGVLSSAMVVVAFKTAGYLGGVAVDAATAGIAIAGGKMGLNAAKSAGKFGLGMKKGMSGNKGDSNKNDNNNGGGYQKSSSYQLGNYVGSKMQNARKAMLERKRNS